MRLMCDAVTTSNRVASAGSLYAGSLYAGSLYAGGRLHFT